MRKILLIVLVVVAPSIAFSGEEPIRLGLYKVKGLYTDRKVKYSGRFSIEREGPNYRVSWFIDGEPSQMQMGIGILRDKVLSIAYLEDKGTDFGVVSLKVINRQTLKGTWTSIFSHGDFGDEEFVFESATIPEYLKPQSPVHKRPPAAPTSAPGPRVDLPPECGKGDGKACYAIAKKSRQTLGYFYLPNYLGMLRAACAQKADEACADLAKDKRFEEYLAKKCEEKNGLSCSLLSLRFTFFNDALSGLKFADLACGAEDLFGCSLLKDLEAVKKSFKPGVENAQDEALKQLIKDASLAGSIESIYGDFK